MKRLLVIAGIVVLSVFIMGVTGRRYVEDRSYTTTVYRTTYSGPQTTFEAVSGVTGISYVIDKIIYSPGQSRDYFYINDSTGTVYGPIRVNAFEPFIDNAVFLKLAAASAIYVTTEVSGDILIEYHNEL